MISEKIVDLIKKQINFSKRLFTVDIIDPSLYGIFLAENLFSYKEVFEYIDIIQESECYFLKSHYVSKKIIAISSLAPYLNEIMLEKFFDISIKLKDPLNRLKASSSLYPYLNYNMKNNLISDIKDYVKNVEDNKIISLSPVMEKIKNNKEESKNILIFIVDKIINFSDEEIFDILKTYGIELSKWFHEKLWNRCLKIGSIECRLNCLIIIYINSDLRNKEKYLEKIYNLMDLNSLDDFKTSFYYLDKLIKSLNNEEREKLLKRLTVINKDIYKSINYIKFILPNLGIECIKDFYSNFSNFTEDIRFLILSIEALSIIPEYKDKWIEKTEKILNIKFDDFDNLELINEVFLFTNHLKYDKKVDLQNRLIEKIQLIFLKDSILCKKLNWDNIGEVIVEENVIKLISVLFNITDVKLSIYSLTQLVFINKDNIKNYRRIILNKILERIKSNLESMVFLKSFFYLIEFCYGFDGGDILKNIENVYNKVGVKEKDLFSVNFKFCTSYAKYGDINKVLLWRFITLASYNGNEIVEYQIDLDKKLSKNIIESNKFEYKKLRLLPSSFLKVRLLIELKKYKEALIEIGNMNGVFEKIICLIEIENNKKINNILVNGNNVEIIEILCVILNLLESKDFMIILKRIEFFISENLLNLFMNIFESRKNIDKKYKEKLIIELTYKIPVKFLGKSKIANKLLIEETAVYISKYISLFNNGKYIKYIKTLPDDKYYLALNYLSKRSNKLMKNEISYISENEYNYNKLKYIFEFIRYKHKKDLESVIDKWENPFERLGGMYFLYGKIEQSIVDELLLLGKNTEKYLKIESLEILFKIWNKLVLSEKKVIIENILSIEELDFKSKNIIKEIFKECDLELLKSIEFIIVKNLKNKHDLYLGFYFEYLKFLEGDDFNNRVKIIIDFCISHYIFGNKNIYLTQFRENYNELELNSYISRLNDIILDKLSKKEIEFLMIKILNETRIGISITIKLVPVLKRLYGDKIVLEIKNQMKENFILDYKN